MKDKIIDKYGNKECTKCGMHYGKACQNCCEHAIELEKDHDCGVIIICYKCLKEFSVSEFKNNFVIVNRAIGIVEWFEKRTGLKDVSLEEHMHIINKKLSIYAEFRLRAMMECEEQNAERDKRKNA